MTIPYPILPYLNLSYGTYSHPTQTLHYSTLPYPILSYQTLPTDLANRALTAVAEIITLQLLQHALE